MLTAAAREAIDSAAEGGVKSGFVRSALVAAYPRLAAALEDCITKLLRDTQVTLPPQHLFAPWHLCPLR